MIQDPAWICRHLGCIDLTSGSRCDDAIGRLLSFRPRPRAEAFFAGPRAPSGRTRALHDEMPCMRRRAFERYSRYGLSNAPGQKMSGCPKAFAMTRAEITENPNRAVSRRKEDARTSVSTTTRTRGDALCERLLRARRRQRYFHAPTGRERTGRRAAALHDRRRAAPRARDATSSRP